MKVHNVLLHGEAVAASLGLLGPAIDDWGTGSFKDVLLRPLFHWYAILLRGVCVKGTNQQNVSLERLLLEFESNAAMFLKAARARELQRSLGRKPTEPLVLAKIKRDLAALKRVSRPVRLYANSVAHYQLRERRLRGIKLRACREKAREVADEYNRLLSRKPFKYEVRDRLVQRFEAELARLAVS